MQLAICFHQFKVKSNILVHEIINVVFAYYYNYFVSNIILIPTPWSIWVGQQTQFEIVVLKHPSICPIPLGKHNVIFKILFDGKNMSNQYMLQAKLTELQKNSKSNIVLLLHLKFVHFALLYYSTNKLKHHKWLFWQLIRSLDI